MRRRASVGLAVATTVVVAVAAGMIVAERREQSEQVEARAMAITGGDPHAGQGKISFYGCGGCHEIPGVERATGKVGPPLSGISGRVYIAGVRENTPQNLAQWIQDPHSVDPQTAMPTLGVTPADARDIAAYLYTLD
ncbi:c-type cytochrome [Phenylobacterium sp. VNQ135]|uniref:c-type cytochrome n=1 Tax=Phenylobacterium sp. VNQ135 TaxID=3400922 RepID=UPI003C0B8F1C